MWLWKITALSIIISYFYDVSASRGEKELLVADYYGMKIYRLNSLGEVTKTYNYTSRVGSLAFDAYNPDAVDNPSFIYGLCGNDSGEYDSGMYRQDIRGSHPETLLRLQDGAVDQILVDSFSEDIYYRGFFRRNYTSYITVISSGGIHVPIITGLQSGCCMALYPGKGLMFWTEDKYLSSKYIASANMDGSNVQYIVTTNLQYPSAIAIDYNDDLLYWADWQSGKIERCDLLGGGRETFLETGHEVDYMLIDGGFLYYTSVGESTIRKVILTDPSYTERFGSFPSGGYFIALDIYPRDVTTTTTATTKSVPSNSVSHESDNSMVIGSIAGSCVVLIIIIVMTCLQERRRNRIETNRNNKVATVLEKKNGLP